MFLRLMTNSKCIWIIQRDSNTRWFQAYNLFNNLLNRVFPQANYQFSPDELRVLKECNTEAFFQRSLPFGTGFGVAAYFGVKHGYFKVNSFHLLITLSYDFKNIHKNNILKTMDTVLIANTNKLSFNNITKYNTFNQLIKKQLFI